MNEKRKLDYSTLVNIEIVEHFLCFVHEIQFFYNLFLFLSIIYAIAEPK